MKLPHPFPYQGSKRKLAQSIIGLFPHSYERIVEPFAGSAAISIAAIFYGKAENVLLNDINEPLIALWDSIINTPDSLADKYENLWHSQTNQEKDFYNKVRHSFNKTYEPDCLLYLLARCVKASIRYNSQGEFNQSPDNRRLGMNPKNMRQNILEISHLFRNRIELNSKNFVELLDDLKSTDIVYMDPPYQGVCSGSDSRYIESIHRNTFVDFLQELNHRNIPFIVSYDGRLGDKQYGEHLPKSLGLTHIEFEVGRSSQATLLGLKSVTYESIYLSPGLNAKKPYLVHSKSLEKQLSLVGMS